LMYCGYTISAALLINRKISPLKSNGHSSRLNVKSLKNKFDFFINLFL